MLRRLFSYFKQNLVAFLALFVALGGTAAYASNTIRGSDIIDNEVSSADVRDDTLGFGGLAARDLGPGSVGSSEVANNSLGNGDFLTGSVDNRVVTDNSLTGDDIDESALDLPPGPPGPKGDPGPAGISTATFFTNTIAATLRGDGSYTEVSSKILPSGSWAVIATANLRSVNTCFSCDINRDASCQLRSQGSVIGSTTDRRVILNGQEVKRSLTMNGGAYLPTGGRVVLWCNSQNNQNETVTDSQMMFLRVGGFS